MVEIRSLAYVVAQCRDPARWVHYAHEVLGAMASTTDEGRVYIKLDARPYRILVEQGQDDRYLASGWELAGKEAFKELQLVLDRAGISFELASAACCAARKVNALARVTDPSGNRHEFFWGPQLDAKPFASPQGVAHFVTGEMGLGHTVLPALNFEATLEFFTRVLGFGVSDTFNFRPDPNAPAIPIHFLHCANGRHHSLALAGFPSPEGCVHIMLEVPSMTDVGRAHDRMQQAGVKQMATLGQHLNDQMTSFYMQTPSTFALEYGFGGLVCDWDKHTAFEATEVSIWGHDFSVGFNQQKDEA
ncbi:VOC family protein [Craterilacuibacter sp. RT1T]|uniref:VOC family protein n=1 Tax=Craterilacuibacter sp. RT1T TaxID=2942211 RepID=UPI0020C12805|nr:VOC family protein [Craterilacuibacter sp. RT1T]MCL6263281.1 VOC family protein [Craterilacuibacter sp. RT1T]